MFLLNSDDCSKYLCCPVCKSNLEINRGIFTCDSCGTKIPVISGIPILFKSSNVSSHVLKQLEYFSKESFNYEIDCAPAAWQESYISRFLKSFQIIRGDVVLDCGTGSGYMALTLAKMGYKVLACDITMDSLLRIKKIAEQQNIVNNLLLICCSAEDLPFKDKSIDYFISNAVLEHLENEDQAMEEINRVCKNKSGLMITVPLSFRYINPILIPLNWLHDKRIGHLRRYSEKIIKSKFDNFSVFNVYYTGHFKKVLYTLFSFLPLFRRFINFRELEEQDNLVASSPYGASNITVFLRRE